MYIPTFTDVQFVKKDGFLTPAMQIYNDELNQALQNNLSDNGWVMPPVTASQLTALATKARNGTFWYESDNHEVVIKINGALRKVVTAAYP